MAEFVEFLSENALKELQLANNEFVKLVANVDKVNQKMQGINAPSGVDNAVKNLTKSYQEQEKAIQKIKDKTIEQIALEKEEIRLKNELAKVNAKIQLSNSQNAITLNTQKSVLKALNGAYAELSEKLKRASDNYQNIIVRGKTAEQTQRQYNRELKNAKNEFQQLNVKILEADKAVGKWNRTGERSIGFIKNLIGAFGVVGGVTLFATISRDIFQTTKELQSLDKALQLVTGTQENFVQQQTFLSRIAEQYGLELKGLTKQFTQFYVSAKDKISGAEIQQIFESVSKAASSMGLSVDQQERAFLALNQMMSKGTVQAEELRGQLGEALPGAFGIMAKAIGVTEKELQDMMKAGDVLASEVLPKFAKELEKAYGIENVQRIDNIASAQTRLTNAWTEFVASLDKDGNKLSAFLTKTLNVFSDILKGVTLLFESENEKQNRIAKEQYEKGYSEQYKYLESKKDLNEKYFKDMRDYYRQDIDDNEKQAQALEERNEVLKKSFGNFFSNQPKLKKEYEANKLQIESLRRLNNKYSGEIRALTDFQLKMIESEKKGHPVKEKTKAQLREEERLRRELILRLREQYLEETKVYDIGKKGVTGDGFLKKLREQKQAFEELQAQVSSNSTEFKNYQKVIDGLQQSIDLIVDPSKAITQTGVDEFMKRYSNNSKDASDKTKELDEALKSLFQTTANGALTSFGMDSLIPMFDGTFNKMWETANTFNEKFAVGMKYIGDVAKQTFEFINQQQQAQYDQQFQRLEQERDIALLFAGESATAREEIERQYEERRRAIQRKQAESQKKIAIFNSIVNTAQGVTSALAMANIPLAIVIGALGAIQTAMIASQQIPQFYKGTENAPEGWAYTQEKGAEIITDKSGKIKSLGSNKGAELTYLNKGDKVYTAQQSSLMFDNGLNEILTSNGISMPKVDISVDNSLTNAKLDKIAKAIENKDTLLVSRDIRGEKIFKVKNGTRQQMLNTRLKIGKFDV
jgi:tape measure domain-containing protein